MSVAKETLMWIFLYLVKWGYASSVPRTDYGELKLFVSPASYNVDTTVLLNDASRRDKEVGYKIKASLDLSPMWTNGNSEFLLKFDLLSPTLHSRGTHITADFMPQQSLWDKYSHSTFYAHWKNGLIEAAYLDQTEPADVINYKKSLISLFQFQIIDGEHNETDISGNCKVMYETLSMQTIRKIKSACGGAEGAEAGVSSRRLVRYAVSGALDALDELYAEEVHTLGDAPAAFALKARAWQRLTRSPAPSPSPSAAPAPAPASAPAATLAAALAALPAALAPHSLQLIAPEDSFDDDVDVRTVWREEAGALQMEEAGEGGTAAGARALLRVLPAVRAGSRAALQPLLGGARHAAELRALLRLLALAAAPAAHRAAAAFLHLHDPDHDPLHDLARLYLDNLALADAPHEEVVLDVLKVGESEWGAGAGALLAAAAAAPRAGPRAERAVREALLKGLAKCKEEECFVSRVEALGNLRREDTVEVLLAHAERPEQRVALSALRALRAMPPAALLHAARLRRLEALALALGARPPALDVRAAALDLLLERSAAAPLGLQRVAAALHDHPRHHPELRRIFWQRLRTLAPHHDAVRTLLRMLSPRLTGWHAQALAGTSSVLEREVAGAGPTGGRSARLTSLQVARGGLLRRGRVQLLLFDATNATDEAVSVELWTRGLEALAGDTGDADATGEEAEGAGGAAEEAEGGLALTVGGALLPAVTLFRGQGELLGHVWAGRGSSPTSVVRALRPLAPRRALLPLAAGAALHWRLRAAHALALDAHATASLWARSASARLHLRAALFADAEARVGRLLSARATLEAEPRLAIAVDLDFYDGVALCVRVSAAAHERRQRVELRAPRVRRERSAAWPAPGRTLALGAPNDATCRTLSSADD